MQVRTSKSGRSAGGGETDAVGRDVGTRNADARLTSASLSRSSSRRRWRCSSTYTPSRPNRPTSAIEQAADAVPLAVERRAAGQRDQPGGAAVQLLERQRALAFRRAQLHARDQPAEIAIPVLAFAEDGKQEVD